MILTRLVPDSPTSAVGECWDGHLILLSNETVQYGSFKLYYRGPVTNWKGIETSRAEVLYSNLTRVRSREDKSDVLRGYVGIWTLILEPEGDVLVARLLPHFKTAHPPTWECERAVERTMRKCSKTSL